MGRHVRGATAGGLAFDALIDDTLDALAHHLENHVDINRFLALTSPAKL